MSRELRPHRSRVAKTEARATPDLRLTRAFPCEAISISPPANIIDRTAPSSSHRPNATPPRAMPLAAKGSPPHSIATRSSPDCWGARRRRHSGRRGSRTALAQAACSARRHRAARSRALDQNLRRYLLPLADVQKLRSAAGGELTRNQAQQCRRIAATLEDLALADRRDQGRDDCRADSWGRRQQRASSFSFVQRTNSASKAAILRSSSAHRARASVANMIT
jgi:hypothetical protein